MAAHTSSWLSDAGSVAAIIAAFILVLGLVYGWFRQVSHALHVVDESVSLGADDRGIYMAPGVDLLNTSSIALRYEVVRFEATVGSRDTVDHADGERAHIAPQERADWHADRLYVEGYEFPLLVRVRYEIQYGRKSRRAWWWRRAIRSGFEADIPSVTRDTVVLSRSMVGPRTDTRVPWTSWSILGWRL
jgi:hypothetical protein